MKVNKNLLLQTFASCYSQTNSISKTINTLYEYELLNKKEHIDLIEITKNSLNIKDILLYLKIDKNLVEYIIFYNNYYTLEKSIKYAFEIVNERNTIKKEIISSMLYPIILIVLTTIALYFISVYIVPQILLLNPDSKNEYTTIFLILKYLPIIIAIILFTLTFLSALIFLLLKRNHDKYINKITNIPIVGKILVTYISLTFVMYIKEIIKNTTFNETTFKLLLKQTKNRTIIYISNNIKKSLEKGTHIFNAVNSQMLLRKDLKQTIMISSNSNDLFRLLDNYYELNIELIKQRIKRVLAILIPIIVSSIGILLILMYLLIMLPILNMSTSI